MIFSFLYAIQLSTLMNDIVCGLYVQPLDDVTKALVYTVAVCYHARLNDRAKFEDSVVMQFVDPYNLPKENAAQHFRKEIER